jgi:hypothetical protein
LSAAVGELSFGYDHAKMKKLSWFALVLELSPLLAFGFLAIVHPVGDPQSSPKLLVRLLDFQGTYWMRNAILVPPPLLVVGWLLSGLLWWRLRFPTALVGTVLGIVLLGFWSLIMVVPLLVHAN